MITDLVTAVRAQIQKQSKQIVIIGDTMVDRWVRGRVEECQEGCQKFVQESVVEVPGGAANAERSLSCWGVRTSLYGPAQDDCPVKTRYLVGDEVVFRADDDMPGGWENRRDYGWVYSLVSEMVGCAGAVLLSDYDKGFMLPKFIEEVAGICYAHSIPCVADCKRAPEVYSGCILKGNLAWRGPWADFKTTEEYVITRGALPPYCRQHGVTYTARPMPEVPCINHVGAGDCFAAHLALGLAYGLSLNESMILAHSAARVYVQHRNNCPPSLDAIAADLAYRETISTSTA